MDTEGRFLKGVFKGDLMTLIRKLDNLIRGFTPHLFGSSNLALLSGEQNMNRGFFPFLFVFLDC